MSLLMPLFLAWFSALLLTLLDGRRSFYAWTAVVLQGLVLTTLLLLLAEVLRGGNLQQISGNWPVGIGIRLRADVLGVLFAVVSAGILLFALLFEVVRGVRLRFFPALVLFLSTGLNGLFLTGDVFNFYVFFEIVMITSFALASYGEDRAAIRAAAIFTIVNLVGSVLLLLAVAALYRVTGSLDMAEIAANQISPRPLAIIATLIFIAFCLKLGLYPFHYWVPAVYMHSHPVVVAILSGAVANIGSYGLLRFGAGLFPAVLQELQWPLLLLGALSVLYGGILAISCRLTTEVLSYSAIGQVGYILIALALGGRLGYAAAVVYALANALNKTLLFLAVGLRGWWMGAAFFVGALSTVGLPPSAGFLAKLELLRVGLSQYGGLGPVVVVVLGSVLSFIYMFQAYQYNFWQGDTASAVVPLRGRWVVLALAGVTIVMGILPETLLTLSWRAALTLEEISP